MKRLVVPMLVLAMGTGCVGKAKYETAVMEKEKLQQRVDEMKLSMEDMSATIRRLEGEYAAASEALSETNRKLAQKASEAGALQADMEQMRQALQELELRKARAEQSLSAYRDLVSRFQAMIDAGTLRVRVINGRMVVELATDILFPPGSASLSKDGRQAIADVAEVLASIPDREYQVAGHTDDVPISSARFPSNWDLGAARAIAVTQLLAESGLPGDRVSAASYSAFKPVDTNRTKEGRAANRRIEIVVMPDLSAMPGYDELEKLGR